MNPVEWSKAQDLLLQLVQVLSPLAERPPHSHLVLNKHFFNPRRNEEYPASQLRNPVRILSTLESVQKQVHEWVGGERMESTIKGKENAPIAKLAEKLIAEVRYTIGKLISSVNIKNPEKDPFLDAMKLIEPELAEIIKAVAQERLEAVQQKPTERSFVGTPRFLPTPSARETLILRGEVKVKKEGMRRGDTPIFHPVPKEVVEFLIPLVTIIEDQPQLKKVELKDPEALKPPVSQDLPLLSRQVKPSPVIQGGIVIQPQEQEKTAPRPMERITIPVVPFVSETRSLTPARKKKKKKGFWHRAEEDEDLKNS
jgi:hypothetical protein